MAKIVCFIDYSTADKLSAMKNAVRYCIVRASDTNYNYVWFFSVLLCLSQVTYVWLIRAKEVGGKVGDVGDRELAEDGARENVAWQMKLRLATTTGE